MLLKKYVCFKVYIHVYNWQPTTLALLRQSTLVIAKRKDPKQTQHSHQR